MIHWSNEWCGSTSSAPTAALATLVATVLVVSAIPELSLAAKALLLSLTGALWPGVLLTARLTATSSAAATAPIAIARRALIGLTRFSRLISVVWELGLVCACIH